MLILRSRGKKILRKYDAPSNSAEGPPEVSEDGVAHQAGAAAHRPFTRSSVKPRLLFQEEIKQQQEERAMRADDVDEEAVTDIEAPIATPSNRKTRIVGDAFSHSPAHAPTPPPTVRTTRRKLFSRDTGAMDVDDGAEISFNSWTRVKSATRESSSSRESRKRGGDPLEGPQKRTRSEPSSAMCID